MQKRKLESRLQLNEEMRAMNGSLFKQQEKEMHVLRQIKHEFKRHLINIFDLSQHVNLDEIQNHCQNLFEEIEIDERGLQLLDFHNFTVSNMIMSNKVTVSSRAGNMRKLRGGVGQHF